MFPPTIVGGEHNVFRLSLRPSLVRQHLFRVTGYLCIYWSDLNKTCIGVARGCTPPRAEKIVGPNLQWKVVSAPPGRECTPTEAEQDCNSPFFGGNWAIIGEISAVGEVI